MSDRDRLLAIATTATVIAGAWSGSVLLAHAGHAVVGFVVLVAGLVAAVLTFARLDAL
jgi:hypothetical protein